ncbi:MAG: PAS domain-containing protein [Candidatus Aenigmarchaeota archaeon]|nr:PAS domain-containing protein [Candidatus Aenigmarchaeota archaeon]
MFHDKKKESEKFGGLFEAIADAAFIADSKSKKLIDCNKRAEKLTGYSRKEILSMRADELHPKDLVKRTMDDFKKHAAGKIQIVETEVLAKDKKRIPVSINSAIVEVDGKPCVLGIFRDISARKKSEKLLQETRTKLQLLYDSSSDAIMLLDEKGFFDCNAATLRLFGCATKEDFCSRHPGNFSPKTQPDGTDSMRYAKNNIAFALKNGSKRFEHLHRRLNGTEFPAEVLLDALVLRGKKVLQARVFDITERKKADKKIKESEEKFRLLAENSIDCIWVLDTKLRFTYISPSAEKILGYKPEQLIGTKLSSHFRKKEFLNTGTRATKAILNYKTTAQATFESKMLNNKNEEVDLEISGKVLLNSQGKLIGLQGISRDITERKKAKKALEQAHTKTKTILEKAQFGVAIVGKDKKIKWVNERAIKMAGVKNMDVVLGKSCREYLCPANQNECPILDKGQKVDNSERIFRRHDGTELPIIKTVNEINFDNEDVLLETFIDITDRKKAEEELHASQLKYMQLFETMTSGVAIYEAVNNGNDFIFKDFNRAGELIENIKKEDVIGKRVTKIFSGVKEFGLFNVFQRVWRTGKSEYFPEALYKDKRDPGTWRESWVYKMPNGEIVSIYNNITVRKQAEEKINEKVEELEKFYKLAIGRELKMIELKKKIEKLKAKLEKVK